MTQNDDALSRINAQIEANAARHLAEMQASWRPFNEKLALDRLDAQKELVEATARYNAVMNPPPEAPPARKL